MDDWRGIGLSTSQVPRLWTNTAEEETSPDWTTAFGLRILYYDGIKTLPTGESWLFSGTKRTTYPYFYSVRDDIENDNSLYYNDTVKSVGLFNKYYNNLHITIDDGRLVTWYINLSEKEINTLDPRKVIFIEVQGNGQYYILNRVIEYKPLLNQSTKVELLTFIDFQPIPNANKSLEFNPEVTPPFVAKPAPPDIKINKDPESNYRLVARGTGTGNNAKRTLNLGVNTIANKDDQTVLGKDGQPDKDAALIIAGGEPGAPLNAITVDARGSMRIQGGKVYTVVNNVRIPVLFTDVNNKSQEVLMVNQRNE